MNDDRSDERVPPPTDPATTPQQSGPERTEKPRPSTFENEWDDAPTTNTFRIPRS